MLGRTCAYLYAFGSAWAYLALPDREWSEGVKKQGQATLGNGVQSAVRSVYLQKQFYNPSGS